MIDDFTRFAFPCPLPLFLAYFPVLTTHIMTTSKIRRTVVTVWSAPTYVDILGELTFDTREEYSGVVPFNCYSGVLAGYVSLVADSLSLYCTNITITCAPCSHKLSSMSLSFV